MILLEFRVAEVEKVEVGESWEITRLTKDAGVIR